MRRDIQSILVAVSVLMVVACASSTPKGDEETSAEKAAKTNTELGRQYMARGDYEIALEKLKRAIAFDKSYAPAHTVLAYLYDNIGEADLAGKEYKEALKYDPDDGSVNNNYGAYLCAQGDWPKAEQYFNKALKDPFYKTPQVPLSNAGICAFNAGDLDKADKFLRQSIEYDENLPASLLTLGKLNYQQGQYLTARAFLQRYEAVASHTEDSLYEGYQIETALGDKDAADAYRRELIQQYPDSGAAKSLIREEGPKQQQ
jgi:type IV pilus assembly protein PilF